MVRLNKKTLARLSDQQGVVVRFNLDRLNKPSVFSNDELELVGNEKVDVPTGQIYVDAILESMVIDLSYASSSMEGNTYSLLDTLALVKYGQKASGKLRSEAVMILNHKKAIEYIAEHDAIDLFAIGSVHALLMNEFVMPYEAGVYRNGADKIIGTSYRPPRERSEIMEAMERLVSVMQGIEHPVERAFYLMTRIPLIQPYIDGNKRTGRIMMNSALIHHGYPPFSFKNIQQNDYIHAMIAFYETGNDTFMKRLFVAAYKGAGAEYEHRETYCISNESFKYREQIKSVVRDAFLGGKPVSELMDSYCVPHSLRADIDMRIESLNPMNAVIYDISPNDYQRRVNETNALNFDPFG